MDHVHMDFSRGRCSLFFQCTKELLIKLLCVSVFISQMKMCLFAFGWVTSAVLCSREMLLCLLFCELLMKGTCAFLAPGLPSFPWSWAAGQVSSILYFFVSGSSVNSHIFFSGDLEPGNCAAPDKMLREVVFFPGKTEVTGLGGGLTSSFTGELARSLLISFLVLENQKSFWVVTDWQDLIDLLTGRFIVSYDLDCAFAVTFWFLKHLTHSIACQYTTRIDASKHLNFCFWFYFCKDR